MTEWDLGDLVRLTIEVRVGGTLTNATSLTIAVKKGDGTTVTPAPTVVNDGTGLYHADVTVDVAGQWNYKWTATGTGQGVSEGKFWVKRSGV